MKVFEIFIQLKTAFKRFLLSLYAGAVLLMLCFIVLSSCDTEIQDVKNEKRRGIHKTFEGGPVMVVLGTDRKELTIADRLNLSIEVTADENYEVELPRFGEKLEQFGIVDYHTSRPVLVENNKMKITRSYLLEPFLSGEYTIPPMKIIFWKKGGDEAKKHKIETETLLIHVRSLLPEKVANLKIHEIMPPVDLPRSWNLWMWSALAVGTAAIAVIGGILLRRRRNVRKTRIIIPAHELAYRDIEKLIAEDLAGKGEIKTFYQRISNILRQYIENRFGLHATEQTTEEFLDSLRSSSNLNKKYSSLLKTFLYHCDLVKFAEHQPTTRDIQKTFDRCKTFIMETEEKMVEI